MNQEQNNINLNSQGGNGVPNNSSLNSNKIMGYDSQTGQPIYANQTQPQVNTSITQLVDSKKKKKKKYWLIPVSVFVAMIVFPVFSITLRIVGVESSIISSISTLIYVLCGFAFIPSVIVAIVLSCRKK